MNTDFNDRLPVSPDDSPSETQSERAQVWILGTRDQVVHMMNEFYVKRIATDFPSETLRERVHFTPIIPAPFAAGKYMTVLTR